MTWLIESYFFLRQRTPGSPENKINKISYLSNKTGINIMISILIIVENRYDLKLVLIQRLWIGFEAILE